MEQTKISKAINEPVNIELDVLSILTQDWDALNRPIWTLILILKKNHSPEVLISLLLFIRSRMICEG
jgi:hypothetical protein